MAGEEFPDFGQRLGRMRQRIQPQLEKLRVGQRGFRPSEQLLH
jgi:hypothetical protein